MNERSRVTVEDLSRVIYSSGKVFDGLSTGRLSTEEFLRSGDTSMVASKSDLNLLLDLRDAAQMVVDHNNGLALTPLDAEFVVSLNAAFSRSGGIVPGGFRPADRDIGVNTRYGRHEPPAVDMGGLEAIIEVSLDAPTLAGQAIDLFINLSRAQPFWDANKRTALLVANDHLIRNAVEPIMLAVPMNDTDPSVQALFNDFLARAYIFEDFAPVRRLMSLYGFYVTTPEGQQVASSLEITTSKPDAVLDEISNKLVAYANALSNPEIEALLPEIPAGGIREMQARMFGLAQHGHETNFDEVQQEQMLGILADVSDFLEGVEELKRDLENFLRVPPNDRQQP